MIHIRNMAMLLASQDGAQQASGFGRLCWLFSERVWSWQCFLCRCSWIYICRRLVCMVWWYSLAEICHNKETGDQITRPWTIPSETRGLYKFDDIPPGSNCPYRRLVPDSLTAWETSSWDFYLSRQRSFVHFRLRRLIITTDWTVCVRISFQW